MPSLFARYSCRTSALSAARRRRAIAASGCSKTETAQARGRDAAAKAGQSRGGPRGDGQANRRAGRHARGRRPGDDFVRSRRQGQPHARRPRRSREGGPAADPARSREAAVQPRPAARGARGALAQLGAPDPQHLPDVGEDAGRAEGQRRPRAGQAGVRPRRASSSSGTLVPQQTLDDADDDAAVEAGELRLVAAERQEPARQHPGVGGEHEAGRSPAARHRDPRAVRRLRREAARQPRRARQDADAGDGGRPGRSAEGDRRDSREDGAVDQGRPAGGSCTSTPIRTGRSPARCRASARRSTPRRARFRSRRWCRTRTRCSSPAPSRACTSRAARSTPC